ncbi:hypothetical protein [Planctomyces sp. SH-PL14]|uniref:DUF7302 family protein n=1 Tax=Planctomyces sp. SH-PL14 TaxID=1632864 RepID=UPI00078B92B7|nr:hypothetical protein [Planctomyces sp. SH-PL14]AMV20416.1 hypothetical protein VT03_21135 [Planctomyces sp. SH-PL14]
MKIKLLVSRGGLDFSQVAGQEIEVADVEGERMIAEGQAVSLEPEAKPEADKKPAKAAAKSKAAEAKPEADA